MTIDIGEANDIHPKDKKDVGERLALIALAKTYGRKIEYSGPQYVSFSVAGSAIRLKFQHTGGGLAAKGGAPSETVRDCGRRQKIRMGGRPHCRRYGGCQQSAGSASRRGSVRLGRQPGRLQSNERFRPARLCLSEPTTGPASQLKIAEAKGFCMKIKPFALLLSLFLPAFPVLSIAQNGVATIAANDKNLRYFGRWDRSDPAVPRSHWGGAYLRTRFTGTSVGLKMQDDQRLAVSIDGEPFRPVDGKAGVTALTAAPLSPGLHSLLVGPSTGGEAKITALSLIPARPQSPRCPPDHRIHRRLDYVGNRPERDVERQLDMAGGGGAEPATIRRWPKAPAR